ATDGFEGQPAHVRALEHGHVRVPSKALVELGSAHVDGNDLAGTPFEKALGEAACRAAGIERPSASHPDGEPSESSVELVAAPAHEPGPVPSQLERLVRCDEPGRLVGRRPRPLAFLRLRSTSSSTAFFARFCWISPAFTRSFTTESAWSRVISVQARPASR